MTRRDDINRSILALALPAIVNNITVPLLGLCDTAIAGHLGSAAYIGAMSVGAMMLNVIYWLCGFLRMGTTGLSAQAFGAGNAAAARGVLRKSLSIAACIAAAVLILNVPLRELLLAVIAPDNEVSGLASLYFTICVWAAPAQLGVMAVSGWFIGQQNTVVPMTVAVGINVINVALSLTLVFGCGLGFAGIAVGTLAANWAGLAGALLFVRRRMRQLGAAEDTGRGEGVKWGRFFSLNADLFFRSACIMGVSLAMTSLGARIGETTLAANAVMMQFFLFFSYFMDGFAFAAEALVGKAAGGRDRHAMMRAVKAVCLWGAAMAVTFALVYAGAASPIVRLLTDDDAVRLAVDGMKPWLVALPPVTVAAFIFDGVYIGLARTRPLLFTTLAAALAFSAVVLAGPGRLKADPNGLLWLGFELYLLLRGVLLALSYLKIQRKSLIL